MGGRWISINIGGWMVNGWWDKAVHVAFSGVPPPDDYIGCRLINNKSTEFQNPVMESKLILAD